MTIIKCGLVILLTSFSYLDRNLSLLLRLIWVISRKLSDFSPLLIIIDLIRSVVIDSVISVQLALLRCTQVGPNEEPKD